MLKRHSKCVLFLSMHVVVVDSGGSSMHVVAVVSGGNYHKVRIRLTFTSTLGRSYRVRPTDRAVRTAAMASCEDAKKKDYTIPSFIGFLFYVYVYTFVRMKISRGSTSSCNYCQCAERNNHPPPPYLRTLRRERGEHSTRFRRSVSLREIPPFTTGPRQILSKRNQSVKDEL